jgi:hypothetical protein
LNEFGDETTTRALMIELFSLFMGPTKIVKDFNQRFTIVINKFRLKTTPTQELQIEFCVNYLPTPISMFTM